MSTSNGRLTWVAGNRAAETMDETSRKILAGGRRITFGAQDIKDDACNQASSSGTSIFDPVLCELAYRWFSPPGGHVLDPFAGGSVRGVVAAALGRRYTGVDLRPEQVAANAAQWGPVKARLTADAPDPTWIVGDSIGLGDLLPRGYAADLVFSCPPYADLEVYSDDPRDLSTMDYPAFIESYRRIVRACVERLRPDRFACFVVGDVRDSGGIYRNFPADTTAAFRDAGASLYNEAVLVTAVGSLPIRVGKQFESGRKLGKTHQNVLVFVKGDPKRATQACGAVEVGGGLPELSDPLPEVEDSASDDPQRHPVSAVLTNAEKRRWDARKAELGVKDDRAALLAMI